MCPPWCEIPQGQHLAELTGWEGFVVHWSQEHHAGGADIRIASTTYIDGTPDPTDPARLFIDSGHQDGVELADAEEFAQQILEAISVAREALA